MSLTNPLPVKHISKAIDEAIKTVEYERTEVQNGLYCRFDNLNKVVGKYFRFGKVYFIAGISGHGKSYILNMLESDLTNTELNKNYRDGRVVILLAFKYEMDAKDEVLRTVGSEIEKSYSYLLSSEVDKDRNSYNKVTDEELESIKQSTEKLKNKHIYYVETAGNLEQLNKTFEAMKKVNPDADIIVTIDHIMLSAKLGEKDDLELMSNTSHTAIRLRKQGAMVILLGQLNGEIEKHTRRETPNLQFPVKTDIHCGNQIYWACDHIFIIHRPELINLDVYGKNKIPTKKLIHVAYIKARGGRVGNLWFEEDFAKGRIIPVYLKIIDKVVTRIYNLLPDLENK